MKELFMVKIGKVRLNRGSGENCVHLEFNVVKEAYTEDLDLDLGLPFPTVSG